MKISHYIFLSFVIILALFSTTTFINFRLSQDVTENTEYFSRSTHITRNSSRFQRNILTMVNGLRGYLLTGERSFTDAYDVASNENDTLLLELSALLTDSSQSLLLKEIKELNDEWTNEYTEPLKQAKMVSKVSRQNLDTFNVLYKVKFASGHENRIQKMLQEKFKAFATFEYSIREGRKDTLAASVSKTRRLSFILTGLFVITALLVIVFLVKKISSRIQKLTNMANDIAAGNYDVSVKDTGKDELSSLDHSLNHMANELSKNISLLKRSNEELDQFAHIVSHDMKGPLRGISNVISWIDEDHKKELTPKISEYLDLIKGRVTRAENLVEGLLSYARADKEETHKETVDLNILINEVLENLPESKTAKIEVSTLPVFYSERLLLYQVFSNLIGNAIKYNDKENPVVSIFYKEHESTYEFFIRDNGIGIPENYHKRIFVIFQTLKDRDSFESTGVGLAIVKKILDSKKMDITVLSQPGEGSTFSFTWPKN